MAVSVKLVALVGVVSVVAANEAELAGDTDPDGSKYGIEAFVRCGSSTGDFVIHAKKAWAPIGYSRFIELTRDPEFWPDQLIYRNIPGFIAQFGVPAKPETTAQWVEKPRLRDDVHIDRFASGKFRRGLVSFAGGGQDSRTHHLFISTGADAEFLGGAAHETPFGTIEGGPDGQGFKNILKWFNGAEAAEAEKEQHNYVSRGNGFMEPKFPMLDRINGCYIIHTLYPGHKEETLHQDKWDEL